MTEWIRTYERGADYMESIDGVAWADAPLPGRFHVCFPQTRGWFGLNYTERCACGAIRFSARERWMNKNETREHRKQARRDERAPKETVTCGTCGQPYEAITGSRQAAERLCTSCWGERLVREHGGS